MILAYSTFLPRKNLIWQNQLICRLETVCKQLWHMWQICPFLLNPSFQTFQLNLTMNMSMSSDRDKHKHETS